MPELSNLIRQRLGAAQAPGTHPDADLISAYAEGGLQPQERTDLTRHLAGCAECRELLALSLPEQAVAPPVAMAVKPRSRFLASYLRVAASLAMVAVVVLLLLKRPHQQQPAVQSESAQNESAQNESAQKQSAQNNVTPGLAPAAQPELNQAAASTAVASAPPALPAKKEASAANAPIRAAMVRHSEQQRQTEIAEAKISPSAQTLEVATAAVAQDYINNQVLANQLFLADQAQPKPPARELPSAPSPAFAREQKKMFLAGGVTPGGSFAGIPAASVQRQTQTISPVSMFPDSTHHGLSISSTLSRVTSELRLKRPQISSQNANAYAMFRPGLEHSAGAPIASTAETAGNLKQSPAFTGMALAGRPRAQSQMFLWRIVQGKLLKSADMSNWLEAYPAGEGIDFWVVRSTGPEVWAGGSDAALVHSSDSGATWQRIVLGAAASGTIIGIEISGNGKNIQATSSSGQSWASQDGGKTWMMVN